MSNLSHSPKPIAFHVGTEHLGSSHRFLVLIFASSAHQFFAALLCIVSRPQISKGSVICLQEVGLQWAGDLHVYFMAKGYSFVTAHYGKAFNNYMGAF